MLEPVNENENEKEDDDELNDTCKLDDNQYAATLRFRSTNLKMEALRKLHFRRTQTEEDKAKLSSGRNQQQSSSSIRKNIKNIINFPSEENVNSKFPPHITSNIVSEAQSQVDDVSVIKFMFDKNFFENSLTNKNQNQNQYNATFFNKIVKLAEGVNTVNSEQKDFVLENNDDININGNELKIEDPDHINHISLNLNNKVEINDNEINVEAEVENVDISNLYNYYKMQLNKMAEKKEKVRKIMKFANLDFKNMKKNNDNEDLKTIQINLLNFGLIIEGNALANCLDDDIEKTFWKLAKKSKAVICCRCNPIQKSQILNFVKNKSGDVCLSIGDGGNDVNMIKMANVGVGIFGKEGFQAAYSADYAISQFKYLRRLLFYHGRYSLIRNSYFVYFFFYKSLIFAIPNLWFAFFSGFSGTVFWDTLYFMAYNSILTTVPPCVIMVFEEDIDITFEDYGLNKEMLKKYIYLLTI